jgi:hypothetical protein
VKEDRRRQEGEGEEGGGQELNHSFIPFVIHSSTKLIWIGFLSR